MSDHHHDHKHDGCCSHGHGHAHDDGPLDTSQMDVASRSLADALRLSFKILTILMVLALLAWVGSGITSVDSRQVGVKKVFGKVTGTSPTGGGLTYTWPFPFGEIDMVDISERQLQVKDFWMLEMGSDAGKSMSERSAVNKGLQPVLDGALFTGDRNLIHARINCLYRVNDPVTYLAQIAQVKSSDILAERDRDKALEQVIRMAVCRATIRSAAARTAQSLKTYKSAFEGDVLQMAQRELNDLLGGPEKKQVVSLYNLLMDVEWPVQAQPAYAAADQARKDFHAKKYDAIGKARELLNKAAGDQHALLVGVPWQDEPATIGADSNLIGQYVQLRMEANQKKQLSKGGDELAKQAAELDKQAEAVLARIDDELTSSRIQGEVSGIIREARANRAAYVETIKSRYDLMQQLLPEFEKSPQMLMDRRWRDTWDQIQSSPLVARQYLSFSPDGRTVVQISRNPDLVKQMTKAYNEWLKAENERKARAEGTPQQP